MSCISKLFSGSLFALAIIMLPWRGQPAWAQNAKTGSSVESLHFANPANESAPSLMPPNPYRNLGKVSDGLVQALSDKARKELPGTALENGGTLPFETAEELAQPVIPLEDAKRVAERGAITAYAALCGMHWKERSFYPFMNAEGKSGRWTEKQMIFIGTLLEITQHTYEAKLKGKDCPPEAEDAIAAKMLD